MGCIPVFVEEIQGHFDRGGICSLRTLRSVISASEPKLAVLVRTLRSARTPHSMVEPPPGRRSSQAGNSESTVMRIFSAKSPDRAVARPNSASHGFGLHSGLLLTFAISRPQPHPPPIARPCSLTKMPHRTPIQSTTGGANRGASHRKILSWSAHPPSTPRLKLAGAPPLTLGPGRSVSDMLEGCSDVHLRSSP